VAAQIRCHPRHRPFGGRRHRHCHFGRAHTRQRFVRPRGALDPRVTLERRVALEHELNPGPDFGVQTVLPLTELGAPWAIATDEAGSVYVTDVTNLSVVKLPVR
jgi:hypothetical protein